MNSRFFFTWSGVMAFTKRMNSNQPNWIKCKAVMRKQPWFGYLVVDWFEK